MRNNKTNEDRLAQFRMVETAVVQAINSYAKDEEYKNSVSVLE